MEADPNHPPGPVNLAWAYVFLDRLGQPQDTVERAVERKLEAPDLLVLPYFMAFLNGNEAEMERAAPAGKQSPVAEDWISNAEASVLAHAGHLQQARRMSRRAVDLARQLHQLERAAMYEAGTAVREAFLEMRLRPGTVRWPHLSSPSQACRIWCCLRPRTVRGPHPATRAGERSGKTLPRRYVGQIHLLADPSRAVGAKPGAPSQAIELLEIAAPYDLAIPGTWFGFFGFLYPSYVWGEAYLAANQGFAAAAEFRKIVDHRGIVLSDPVDVLAKLQLARMYASMRGEAKAKSAYQGFLAFWANADRDVPVLTRAKVECSRLP